MSLLTLPGQEELRARRASRHADGMHVLVRTRAVCSNANHTLRTNTMRVAAHCGVEQQISVLSFGMV